ncbi:DUF3488 and DUF4129 domain-containing transglutaminase family protein [Streptomyces sp. NPDC058045]|uniref:transglutaminase TgpA family protein n=1 Tax=Streptomyces sp. NPDC058045 TaxID=3346311 RepID=UPI0036E0D41D
MSGRSRLAVSAALASLLAACALLPLVDRSTWILQAAFLVAVQAGVGTLARRIPLARPLTVLAQALVSLLLLTLVFAREQALAGVLPGPQAIDRFGLLLQAGSDDVGRYATPAPLSDGIRLMLVGGVLVVALLVDALAVTFRNAAPAGLPLLALYSVAAGLADNGAAWLWFLLAAAGYLLLLLAEGRDRLSRWGRVFGGAPREPDGSGGRAGGGRVVAPVRTGRRIGLVALGVAVVVPLTLPSLDGGLLGGDGHGRGPGRGGGGTISAVNPLVSLQNSLNQPDDRQVLAYRTTTRDTEDLYLRIVSLDDFDGQSWKPSLRRIEDVPATLPTPQGLNPGVGTTEIRTSISAADSYKQDWLPMPYPATQVRIDGRWRYEPVGRTIVGDHRQNTGGARYEVTSLAVQPTAEQLAAAPDAPAGLRQEFTSLPRSVPPVVKATARAVTRGADNDYQRAVKLQDFFAESGNFSYDTTVETGGGTEAIARFLKQRRGFCVHFSFSMATMARTLGIPARVAVGFTPGSPAADGTMSVGLKDAHAWPELYFEGVGWTRFEPTPSRGTAPQYTRPNAPSSNPDNPSEPSSAAPVQPTTAPSESAGCTPEMKKLDGCGSAPPQVTGGSDSGGPPLGLLLGGGLAVLLVLSVPLLPMLWRLRERSVRLGSRGRTEPDAADRTLAAWLELTDTAWDYGIAPDGSLTPRRAADRIVRVTELDPAAAESVQRVAAAVEQVLYAPRPQPAAGLAQDVRRASAAIGAGAGRAARLRALLAPRSAARALWWFRARRHTLATRVATWWTTHHARRA